MDACYNEEDIQNIYQRQIDMVFKIAYSYMKNIADSEDAASLVFIKFIKSNMSFDNLEHEKAWFIVTTTRTCKDLLKQWWHKNTFHTDMTSIPMETFEIDTTLDIILSLPTKYKTVVYLYYYEDYNTEEISEILKIPSSTIRNQLSRARSILKRKLGDYYE